MIPLPLNNYEYDNIYTFMIKSAFVIIYYSKITENKKSTLQVQNTYYHIS